TSQSPIVGPDRCSGRRNGAARPASTATRAISSWSVETTARSTKSRLAATWPARATSDTPPTVRRFLSGIPLEPPRAGTTASTRLPANMFEPQHRRKPCQPVRADGEEGAAVRLRGRPVAGSVADDDGAAGIDAPVSQYAVHHLGLDGRKTVDLVHEVAPAAAGEQGFQIRLRSDRDDHAVCLAGQAAQHRFGAGHLGTASCEGKGLLSVHPEEVGSCPSGGERQSAALNGRDHPGNDVVALCLWFFVEH